MCADLIRPLYDSLAIMALACTPNILLVVVAFSDTSPSRLSPTISPLRLWLRQIHLPQSEAFGEVLHEKRCSPKKLGELSRSD